MTGSPHTAALPSPSPFPFMGVSKRKRAVFYTQLARMLRAGIGPVRSLTTLAGQGGSWRLSRAAGDMAAQAQAGASLAEAFARHPNVFPPNEVRMIEASTHAGAAPETMLRIAGILERFAKAWSRVILGLLYPCICLLVAFVGLPLIVAYFTGAFGGVGHLLRGYIGGAVVVFAGGFLLVTGLRTLSSRSGIRVGLDRVLLAIPIYGKLARRLALNRFADTFQCLYAAGLMVPEAMAHAALACGNGFIGTRIANVAPQVQDGIPLAVALAQTRVVPRVGLNLIEVGESSGELDATLLKFAEYQQDDLDIGLARMAKVLPMLALFLMIGILAYAVLAAWGAYVRGIQSMMGH